MSTIQGPQKIEIKGWIITATKKPILTVAESDELSHSLSLPLPEICFGKNALTLELPDRDLALEFSCSDALKHVGSTSDLQVSYSDTWKRAHEASAHLIAEYDKKYDWTYTTLTKGKISHESLFRQAPKDHPGIPFDMLARTDIPIVFFSHVHLFEDELGDNGTSDLSVRVRVNASSFFALQRFVLRVDGVLFRVFDVRVFHLFGSDEILRQTTANQASYSDMKNRCGDNLLKLTDLNWVANEIEHVKSEGLPPWVDSNEAYNCLEVLPLSEVQN